ncbi:REPTOR-binding partner isoform X1 [Pieris napi]|uniref:REPTOR-binding partner isoform X1 n=1 Tax=Pieris napi TaxID=78633 RepID=UPI001FBAAB6C|nr:REPTOR-binding partner isoform X1 [Pieris napi]
MNIDFETMAVLEEESQNKTNARSFPLRNELFIQSSVCVQTISQADTRCQIELSGTYGSTGGSAPEGGERREGGKRGRRPGRKAQDKQDMKAKLERSRQSARECRARKKLRYQYLEELVADRERSVLALRKELEKFYTWNLELDQGRMPEGIEAVLQEIGVLKQEEKPSF